MIYHNYNGGAVHLSFQLHKKIGIKSITIYLSFIKAFHTRERILHIYTTAHYKRNW